MKHHSEDYKRGYKEASVDFLFVFLGEFLIVPIIVGTIAGAFWLIGLISPQFAERLWQGGEEFHMFLFGAVVFAVVLAVWKTRNQKFLQRPFKTIENNAIDKEREAEIFYGFRKPDESNL